MVSSSEAVLIALVSLTAFVSTSFDNLLVLVPRFGMGDAGRRAIQLGYLAGVAVVILASWIVSRGADFVAPQNVRWLGLLPMAMALYQGAELVRRDRVEAVAASGTGGAMAVAGVTVSLSADNLGVFVPLFAETPPHLDAVIVASVLAGGFAWGRLAERLARAGAVRSALERWGPRLAPLLLMAIGAYILFDTPTDIEVDTAHCFRTSPISTP